MARFGMALVLFACCFRSVGASDPPDSSKRSQPGRLKQLIKQLDSPKFQERQAAAKELRAVGEPAVTALRDAAQRADTLESRRRALALINVIREDTIKHWVAQLDSPNSSERESAAKELRKIGEPAMAALQEELRKKQEYQRRAEGLLLRIGKDGLDAIVKAAEASKDYKNAAALLGKAIEDLKQRLGEPQTGDVPLLTEAYLRLARVRRKMDDGMGAAQAYDRATYYSNYNREKRRAIERECALLLAGLMPGWERAVREKIAKNPSLKTMAAKYPLVLLHSRRFAGGGYLQSCYSFVYESADESKHRNDVQLQFDNGRGDRTFQVNMVGGQRNTVADLGKVDFEADPLKEPRRKPLRHQEDATAVAGHVYLEKVEDSNGNHFYVVFEVIAVDPDSQYMAFIWRRLPGGKVVRQN